MTNLRLGIDAAAASIRRADRRWMVLLGMMLAIFVLGAYGLVNDSISAGWEFWCPLHVAFGIALSAAIIANCRRGACRSADSLEARRAQGRHLSRMVYLLLYALLGVQRWIETTTNHAEPRNFQPYLVFGLSSIVIIRVLTTRDGGRLGMPALLEAASGDV